MQQFNRYPFWTPRFWHGMRMLDWLRLATRNRWRIHWTRWPMAAGIFGFAVFNSTASLLQEMLYGRRIRDARLPMPPLFILGHWRSGTTYLHDLLDLDPLLACPNTYQCFAPHHFLPTEWFITRALWFLMPTKRPMDNVAAGWSRPQEDEFAMCSLGLPSPYLRLAFPNEGPVFMEYLDLEDVSEQDRRRWGASLARFARSLSIRYPTQRLTFKSPPHTGRLRVLLEHFPEARFVHLTRNPYELFASTIRLWEALEVTQALQIPRDIDHVDYVLACFDRMYGAFQRQRLSVPPDRLVDVRYEDLVLDPVGQLERIYTTLDLGDFQQAKPRLQQYLAAQRGYRANQHSPLEEHHRHLIQARWGDYIQRYGYADVDTPEQPSAWGHP